MIDPISIAALASAGSSIYKGITGGIQQSRANRALADLEGQEPLIEIPASLRQRAQEPVSVQLMNAQQETEARRTAQSVGALQKAGARGILGGLSGVMDAERSSERGRVANYNQERKAALGQLGAAELDVQGRKMNNYLSKISAAARSREAGQQNVAGALDTVSNVGQQYIGGRLSGLIDAPQGKKLGGFSQGYLSRRLEGAPQVDYTLKGLN